MKSQDRVSAAIAVCTVLTLLGAVALVFALGDTALAMDESPLPAASPQETTEAPPPPLPPGKMTVVPADENRPASASPVETPKPPPKKARAVKKPVEVEPASARLKIKKDAWILTAPSNMSKHIKRAHTGKFVNVTGSTRYYLRVKLKEGDTGYVPTSAVELVSPTDKIFRLTSNAAVLAEPNRWARKVAEVHQGHDVHVIGIALSYMQIRMRSGLTGFIPATALQ